MDLMGVIMKKRILLALVMVMGGGAFDAYGMEGESTGQSKKIMSPWKITNHMVLPLYVRIRGEKTLIPTKSYISRSSDSAYASSAMEKDGTIKLDTGDTITYYVNEINFPIRGRIWTAKDNGGMTFTLANPESLIATKKFRRYPHWLISKNKEVNIG